MQHIFSFEIDFSRLSCVFVYGAAETSCYVKYLVCKTEVKMTFAHFSYCFFIASLSLEIVGK
jgi:hypothetical protein